MNLTKKDIQNWKELVIWITIMCLCLLLPGKWKLLWILFLFIVLADILGIVMDAYFKKKYGQDVLPFAKDIGLWDKQENNSPAKIYWRRFKEWSRNLFHKSKE